MFTAELYHGHKNSALRHQFWCLLKQTRSSDWFTVGQGQVHKSSELWKLYREQQMLNDDGNVPPSNTEQQLQISSQSEDRIKSFLSITE